MLTFRCHLAFYFENSFIAPNYKTNFGCATWPNTAVHYIIINFVFEFCLVQIVTTPIDTS